MTTLVELKALAEMATPGKWYADKHLDWAYPTIEVLDERTGRRVTFYNSRPEYQTFLVCGTRGKAELEWANADFIAAANPATVLALIQIAQDMRNMFWLLSNPEHRTEETHKAMLHLMKRFDQVNTGEI